MIVWLGLLPSLAVGAPTRVDDVLEHQRLHGYHSVFDAMEQMRAASDAPDANSPPDLQYRYYSRIVQLAVIGNDATAVKTALAPLEALGRSGRCAPCEPQTSLVRAQLAMWDGDDIRAQREVERAATLIGDQKSELRIQLASAQARLAEKDNRLADAIGHAVEALELSEQLSYPAIRADTLNSLVSLNANLGYIDRAQAYAEEGIALARQIGFDEVLGFLWLNQGNIYSITGDLGRQFAALNGALAIAGGDPGLARIEIITRSNLADYHLKTEDYDAALEQARKALALAGRHDDRHGTVVSSANIGLALAGLGRVDEGVAALRESIALAEQIDHKGYVSGITAELVRVLEGAGRYREALDAIHRIAEVEADVTRQERERAVLEVQERYATERKNREIARLEAENRARAAEVAARSLRQRLWAALAMVFALSAALLVQWLIRSRRNNKHLRAANANLAEESSHDPLTGAFNRRHFEQQMVRIGDDHETVVGLMVLDIDHFKQVNDRFGHDAGDAVLVELVRRLEGVLRSQDSVVRWGGEEFVLMLPGTAGVGLETLAMRVLQAVGGVPMQYAGRPLPVTASVGTAAHPVVPGQAWEDALRLADAAMYVAKQTGRNRAVLVTVDPDATDALAVATAQLEMARGGGQHPAVRVIEGPSQPLLPVRVAVG